MNNSSLQIGVLRAHGADDSILEELLACNRNEDAILQEAFLWPLKDEEFVETWLGYKADAPAGQVFEYLREKLVQLRFPISAGISKTDGYLAVTRRGEHIQGQNGLRLTHPERLHVEIYRSAAGKIPLLITQDRGDFISLVRALTCRNEPEEIPDFQGALMVSGYNNWDRIRSYRERWATFRGGNDEAAWSAEFERIIPEKHLYQDRFILMTHGNYSGVTADDLGLSEEEWLEKSLVIRREHEVMHYYTRRLFPSMKSSLLEELIADYAGMMASERAFCSMWFLRFMGINDGYPRGSKVRMDAYVDRRLSQASKGVLRSVLISAAHSLETFTMTKLDALQELELRMRFVTDLCSQTLEELASKDAQERLEERWQRDGTGQ